MILDQHSVTEKLIEHLKAVATAQGFSEPKHNQWVRYSSDVNSRRELLDKILAVIKPFDPKDHSFLDVGCGYGNLLVAAMERFGRCYGIEIVPERVEWSRRRAQAAEVFLGSATELPWPSASFDLVISTDVFEHIDHKMQCITAAEIRRVLKLGGYAFITVPNRFQIIDEHHFVLFGSWLRGDARARYVRMFSKNPLVDCWELTRTGWRSLFRSQELEILADLRTDLQQNPIKKVIECVLPQRTCLLLQRPLQQTKPPA
jgi:ubiquinone/menaquinone biosynthesis C-methylase UbiE